MGLYIMLVGLYVSIYGVAFINIHAMIYYRVDDQCGSALIWANSHNLAWQGKLSNTLCM